MNLIELTETWAAQITLCTNGETLGIDNETSFGLTEAEAVNAVVAAGGEVVADWSPGCEAADYDGIFQNWNGGKFYRPTYGCLGIAIELYHREPIAQDDDDLVYGEWEWMSRKDTPRILQDGMTALVDRIGNAMQAAKDLLEAESERQLAEFEKENATE